MKRNKYTTAILLCFLAGGVSLFSQDEALSSGDLVVIAAHKERINNKIVATGGVEIRYKELKLFADEVDVNVDNKDAHAKGNVVVQFPQEVIYCDEIHFNLESSEGNLKNVRGMMQPTIFYKAESMTKDSENVYSIKKAEITSCSQTVPRWKFSCAKANFKKNDYVEMWGSLFKVKKVPLFYFPYLRYPLGEERHSGFLMPQAGYTGVKGFVYSQGFYWAISRSMDATINFDLFSAKGKGGGVEFRYLFGTESGGKMNLYYFDFNNIPEFEDKPNGYIIRLDHNQTLPFDFVLGAGIDYQSSFNFLREFDNDLKRALVTNRKSQAFLSRSWSYFNFSIRASRFETAYAGQDNSKIRHYFPQIGFTSSKIKLFPPLYFSFTSSMVRWEDGWKNQYLKGKQTKSQNLSFEPSLTLPFTVIPWMTLNSSVNSNFTYHFQSKAPGSNTIVQEPILARNYGVTLEFIGPVFYRTFFDERDTPRAKHIIEPSVVYRFESPTVFADRIITASGYFFRNHYLKYGLTNHILIKQNKMIREIFTFGLSQYHYLLPEQSPMSRYLWEGEVPGFSDITGYLRFYPGNDYSVDVSAGFNPYHVTFSSLRLGANLRTPDDPVFLRLNWYKSINPWRETATANRHQINFYGGIRIPQLDMHAQAEIDYNIQDRELLYTALTLGYKYQCIDFKVDLRIFYFRDEPEIQFRINFGLGNIGKTTDLLGGIGF